MFTRGDLKRAAKAELKVSYWLSFGVIFASMILGGFSGGFGGGFSSSSTTQFTNQIENGNFDPYQLGVAAGAVIASMLFIFAIVFVVKIFLSNPIEAGTAHFFASAPYGNRNFEVMFSSFKGGRYGKITKAMFLRDLYLFLWSLIGIVPAVIIALAIIIPVSTNNHMTDGNMFGLIFGTVYPLTFAAMIPAIIKQYSYRLVPYIIADNPNFSAKEALTLSVNMMKGRKWFAFVLDLSFIGWILLGLLGCFVGVYFVYPYIYATNAQFYLALRALNFGQFQQPYQPQLQVQQPAAGYTQYPGQMPYQQYGQPMMQQPVQPVAQPPVIIQPPVVQQPQIQQPIFESPVVPQPPVIEQPIVEQSPVDPQPGVIPEQPPQDVE